MSKVLISHFPSQLNCDGALFLWGILAVSMSLLLFAQRFLAWRGSKRSPGGRQVDATSLFENGALSVAIGVSFFVLGGALTVRQIACGSYAQLPAFVYLGWTWWPGIWLAIAIGIAVGIRGYDKRFHLRRAPSRA